MSYTNGQSSLSRDADDIRAAMELGIDGFAINAFSGKQAKGIIGAFIRAADSVGAQNFKLFLSADMSLGFSAADIIDTLRTFGDHPRYLHINGKPLLSTFGGDKLGNDWWQHEVLTPLAASGNAVTFVPYFDRPDPNLDIPDYESWMKVLSMYPSVDGLFNFLLPKSTPFYERDSNSGFKKWSGLVASESLALALHDSGKIYMAQYMPYYWAVCHSARQYMEFQGGRGMENAWTSLITKQKPRIVQLVTWNDFSESTFIQPTQRPNTKHPLVESLPHLGYFELLKYYVSWYRAQRRPSIVQDGLFFFYRTHANDAVARNDTSACSLGPISQTQKWGYIKDVIYVTTALTSPAEVVVKVGDLKNTYRVPAGLTTLDVPFKAGVPIFELWRNGQRLLSLSGREIVEQPSTLNFNVHSGYVIANGQNSESWTPSDKWKDGYVADWLRQDALSLGESKPR